MSAAEIFGKIVYKNYLAHPRFTRNVIRMGFGIQHGVLKRKPDERYLPSQRYLTQISMQSVLAALKHPKNSALVNIFTPCEPLHALCVHPLCAEGLSSYLTGGYSEKGFLEYAERRGVPDTFCSYHKAMIGAAESGVLPRPRMMITTSTVCDANISSFRRIAQHYKLSEFVIDVPHRDSDEAAAYVAGQLHKMTAYIEDSLGAKMDAEKLAHAVRNTNESIRFYRQFLTELETKAFPTSVSLQMFNLLPSHILMGADNTRRFFEMQAEDIKKCAPSGAKRIFWSHVLPYYAGPLKDAFDFSGSRQLLINDLSFDAMEEIDEKDPYLGMARRLIRNTMNGDFSRKADAVATMCKRLHANGVVLFCHWGCKQSSGGVFLLKRALEDAGVPSLLLDGDACDRRNSQTGQMETRLQAFLEMLEK